MAFKMRGANPKGFPMKSPAKQVAKKATEAMKKKSKKRFEKFLDENMIKEFIKPIGSATKMKSPLEHEGGAMGYEAHRKEFGPNHSHKRIRDKHGDLVLKPSKSKAKWDMSNTTLGGQMAKTAKKAIKEAKKKSGLKKN